MKNKKSEALKLAGLTLLTLFCFAANSLLARLGLVSGETDPVSFTAVRIISGALALLPFVLKKNESIESIKKVVSVDHIKNSIALAVYALFFSVAYVNLDAGFGAMILFTMVQLTIFVLAFIRGHRFKFIECLGAAIALSGLVVLLRPSAANGEGSPLLYSILMALSGVGWGVYSLNGAKSKTPIRDNAFNFLIAAPFFVALLLLWPINISQEGFLIAVSSGVLTSAMAYSLWYSLVPQLKISTVAVVQLAVPLIATALGVILLNEKIDMNFIIAAVLIVVGILIKNTPVRSST